MSSSVDDMNFGDFWRNSSQESFSFSGQLSPTPMEELEMTISNPPSNTTENYPDAVSPPTDLSYIKEGLKQKIKNKRPDLKTEPFENENDTPETMSPEVLAKIEERRKRNCLAAKKCRNKRKNEISVLKKRIKDLELQNRALTKENCKLKRERNFKSTQFVEHPFPVVTQPVVMDTGYIYNQSIPLDLQSVDLQPIEDFALIKCEPADIPTASQIHNLNHSGGYMSMLTSSNDDCSSLYDFPADQY